ncbi:MAG: glycosyl transferase, partial [Actinobacteria bacterium]|nr:glycosyl transferase [Actinomycetota bacterium]
MAISLAVTATAFGILGMADDLRSIGPLTRLALQAILAGLTLPLILWDITGPVVWIALLATGVLIWVITYVNVYNFMDGINGISVAQAVVAGGFWYLIGQVRHVIGLSSASAIVALAAIGFAPFNFPRARIFLGDVGSYFFGAWLAVLA